MKPKLGSIQEVVLCDVKNAMNFAHNGAFSLTYTLTGI